MYLYTSIFCPVGQRRTNMTSSSVRNRSKELSTVDLPVGEVIIYVEIALGDLERMSLKICDI